MGTIGLSFGSATSGQGFDVASTVSAIQASEQAIETPWQNELTGLQSQDSVLSALGTDLGSLSTALQSLTDFNGVFAEKQGSSSNTDLLSLTSAGSSAVAGSHTVVISQLAQTSSDVSTAIPSASDTLTGSITIQGKTFDTGGTSGINTLTDLASAINSAAIGATASVITDSSGSRLSIVSGTSGAAGQLDTITSTLADGGTSISFPGPPDNGQAGQDAKFTVDGVQVTSPSNTVTNAISGVTFQLLSSASPNTQIQVQVTDNTTDIGTAVSNFVSAYNAVAKDINTEETSSASGTPALLGSPILAQLQSQLTSALFGGSASGSINNLSQLGISLNDDGTLTLDSDTLDGALSSSLSDVTGFFQNSKSFGQTLSTAVNNLGTQAPNGAIYLAQQQNAAQETALNTDITNENTLLAAQKTQLTSELNTANQILQSIPSQLNEVNEMYSAITGYNTGNGG